MKTLIAVTLSLSLITTPTFGAVTLWSGMEESDCDLESGLSFSSAAAFPTGGASADDCSLASAAAINTDAVKYGTYGLDAPTGSDYASFTVTSGDLLDATTEGAIGFWFRMTAFTNGTQLLRAYNTSAANNQITITLTGTDDATGREISVLHKQQGGGDNTVTTTSADMSLSTWYYVLFRWEVGGAVTLSLTIYSTTGSLHTGPVTSTASLDSPAGINILQIGDVNGGSLDAHFDNLTIGDVFEEPLEDNLTITSYTEYGGGGSEIPTTLRRRRN